MEDMGLQEKEKYNMRQIKFRAWNPHVKQIVNWEQMGDDHWDLWDEFADDKTIMQFTGLKDKNGKEIYESDLMKHPEFDDLVTVNWAENGYWTLSGWDFMRTNPSLGEVVGNIYEHPELLKQV
jgi:hypothetical protein